MIAVLPGKCEREIVRELFELFKTPWEFYQSNRTYDIALVASDNVAGYECNAKAVIVYGGTRAAIDDRNNIASSSIGPGASIHFPLGRIPLTGNCLTFDGKGIGLVEESQGRSVGYLSTRENATWIRLGYDLFREIGALLSFGQPAADASIPTLERHIVLLRALIVGVGLPLIEVPPVPDGFKFIACLTHDVDHPTLRRHKFDLTTFGFIHRALIGTGINVLRGRATIHQWATNCLAVLKTPLVFMGLARDFWRNTFQHYSRVEKGLGSTYFFIPRKNCPGLAFNGAVSSKRGAAYDLADVTEEIERLRSDGCEVGVHGIDAWMDSARGVEERRRISLAAGSIPTGIRMHWLYFNSNSPTTIEAAGFTYDSTWGYNEVVGFRAGTSQVFRPPGAASLLELPLIIMDTALFFPVHMNLSFQSAKERVLKLLDAVVQSGGALTVNWHDRSIAPERLWGEFYVWLIQETKRRGAWFATGADAVTWFNKRRSVSFEEVTWNDNSFDAKVRLPQPGNSAPGLIVRVHYPKRQRIDTHWTWSSSASYADIGFNECADVHLKLAPTELQKTIPGVEPHKVCQRIPT